MRGFAAFARSIPKSGKSHAATAFAAQPRASNGAAKREQDLAELRKNLHPGATKTATT
jgi:hypothetical protein